MTEQTMESSERELLPEASIGFYSWNVQENLVHGDDVVASVFGVSLQDLSSGVPIEDVIRYVNDGDKQRLAKAIHEAIVTGAPFYSHYEITHPDKREVRVAANGRCLRDGHGVPSIYSGTITVQPQDADTSSNDPLEKHCRAALGIAKNRRHALATRYLSSALNVLGAKNV
jgi:PAS domain-containing protein